MSDNPEYIVMVEGGPNNSDMRFIVRVDDKNIWYSLTQAKAIRFKALDAAYATMREYRTRYGEFRDLVAVRADVEWTKERRQEFLPHWKWEQCRHKSAGLLSV